jgi:hypothetical protein
MKKSMYVLLVSGFCFAACQNTGYPGRKIRTGSVLIKTGPPLVERKIRSIYEYTEEDYVRM